MTSNGNSLTMQSSEVQLLSEMLTQTFTQTEIFTQTVNGRRHIWHKMNDTLCCPSLITVVRLYLEWMTSVKCFIKSKKYLRAKSCLGGLAASVSLLKICGGPHKEFKFHGKNELPPSSPDRGSDTKAVADQRADSTYL